MSDLKPHDPALASSTGNAGKKDGEKKPRARKPAGRAAALPSAAGAQATNKARAVLCFT